MWLFCKNKDTLGRAEMPRQQMACGDMTMNTLSIIKELFGPVFHLVDDLHINDEEGKKLKNEILQLQNESAAKMMESQAQVLEYKSKVLESQSVIIKEEITGKSWIQRTWRPITMLTFLTLIVLDSFGLLTRPLSPEAWFLLQLGIGGYIASRGVEKITPQIASAIKTRNGGSM